MAAWSPRCKRKAERISEEIVMGRSKSRHGNMKSVVIPKDNC